MVRERGSTSGPPFWRNILTGIIIIVVAGIILAYLKGWLLQDGWISDRPHEPSPLPDTQQSSPVEAESTQSRPKSTVLDSVEVGDHRQLSSRKKNDSKSSDILPTVEPESNDSQRYSLMISYDEDCEAIAISLRDCLKKRKYYKQLEVQMDKLHRNRRDGTKCSIEFLYRDATQENLAKKIWTNLATECRHNIEIRRDFTIDPEFRIVIEFKKEET